MHYKLAFALALLGAPAVTMAEAEDAIASDRPDFVDSGAVVGKGRVQLEAGFAQDRDRDGAGRERSISTPLLLRIGIADSLELRIESEGRLRYRADGTDGPEGAAPVRRSGYGDAALGVKWHVREGEGASPAIGVIGQLDFATGSRTFRGEGTRPSLRATAEWDLAPDWSLGVMPGIAADRDERGRRFATGLLGISLDKAWNDRVHTFFEFAAQRIAKARHGGSTASLDVGGTCLLTNDVQLDAAVSRGLNRRTPDYSLTFGLSVRR